jgi:uroporphyrinogen decarboxylase
LLSLLSDQLDASSLERDLAAETDVVSAECHAWILAGADLLLLADDIAYDAGPYFSPALFAHILLPRYQQIVARVAGLGVPLGFHSDGDLSLLLPALVGVGFACFSLQPEAVSVAEFRARFGGQVTLLSGIRAEWLSQRLTHRIVSPDPSADLADLAGARNLILASACGISTLDAVAALKKLYRVVDVLR